MRKFQEENRVIQSERGNYGSIDRLRNQILFSTEEDQMKSMFDDDANSSVADSKRDPVEQSEGIQGSSYLQQLIKRYASPNKKQNLIKETQSPQNSKMQQQTKAAGGVGSGNKSFLRNFANQGSNKNSGNKQKDKAEDETQKRIMKINNQNVLLMNQEERKELKNLKPLMNDVSKAVNNIKSKAVNLNRLSPRQISARSKSRNKDDDTTNGSILGGSPEIRNSDKRNKFNQQDRSPVVAVRTQQLLNMDLPDEQLSKKHHFGAKVLNHDTNNRYGPNRDGFAQEPDHSKLNLIKKISDNDKFISSEYSKKKLQEMEKKFQSKNPLKQSEDLVKIESSLSIDDIDLSSKNNFHAKKKGASQRLGNLVAAYGLDLDEDEDDRNGDLRKQSRSKKRPIVNKQYNTKKMSSPLSSWKRNVSIGSCD